MSGVPFARGGRRTRRFRHDSSSGARCGNRRVAGDAPNLRPWAPDECTDLRRDARVADQSIAAVLAFPLSCRGHQVGALIGLVRQTGLSALIATHNLELARRLDRVLALEDGMVVERKV